jgi:enoyl-CoA hydratase/carnithine racemase
VPPPASPPPPATPPSTPPATPPSLSARAEPAPELAPSSDPAAEVIVEDAGRVRRITINRPERRNALSGTVIGLLRSALADARADPAVRVVVLTGAGDRAFSAGADLVGASSPAAAPQGLGGPTAGELHEARGELGRLFEDLWDLGKPSIARVRGYALAGGLGLALACDLIVAADDAIFGTPEIDIGIWPFMVTVALLQAMTPKRALELMMTGRRVGAEEAERIGIVNRVVAVEELDSAVEELAQALARKPPGAMRAGRDSFFTSLSLGPREALSYLHPLLTVATLGEEAAEGRAAFAEHRPPKWAES